MSKKRVQKFMKETRVDLSMNNIRNIISVIDVISKNPCDNSWMLQ
nr:MAG TPA: hypothetical protein [Caudoviricetes sp.]